MAAAEAALAAEVESAVAGIDSILPKPHVRLALLSLPSACVSLPVLSLFPKHARAGARAGATLAACCKCALERVHACVAGGGAGRTCAPVYVYVRVCVFVFLCVCACVCVYALAQPKP